MSQANAKPSMKTAAEALQHLLSQAKSVTEVEWVIEDKPQRVTVMPADLNAVKDFVAQHTGL